jgi:hypothetical protein
MTDHIDTCAAILAQCMRITAQGKWHVFFDYMAHVNSISVYWLPSDHIYGCDKMENPPAKFTAYIDSEWANTPNQLAAIRTELDKLEGGE